MPRQDKDRLTAKGVESLIRAGGPKTISDGAGLSLSISASGHATWILRYRLGGRAREFTIGGLAEYSLSDARTERDRLRQGIQRGEAPKRNASDLETFEGLSRQWYERIHKRRAPVKHPQTIALLENHILPRIGDTPLEKITPTDVAEVVYRMLDSGLGRSANVARQVINRVLSYGVALGLIQINPAASINASIAGHKEQPRDRALDDGELRVFLRALDTQVETVGRNHRVALRLLLLLGVRKMELLGASWDEFGLDASLWTLPKHRIKTRKTFTVPLPRQGVTLLREAHMLAMGSSLVFPRYDNRGLQSNTTLNRALNRLDTPLEPFTVHDLRRTMRTGLSAIGVRFDVAERCINHQLPGIASTYDVAELLPQRREALQRWADHLESLTGK